MRNRRSRTFRLVAPLFVVAFALGACGGDDDDSGGGGDQGGDAAATTVAPTTTEFAIDPAQCPVAALPSSGGPVEIKFWHAMTEKNEATLQALADTYNASQSAVKG